MEERRSQSRRNKERFRRASDDVSLDVPASGDRRAKPRPGSPERRAMTRRRPVDRRLGMEAFDAETAESVQDIILKTGILVRCPHCNEQLTLGPVIRNQMQSQREVRCARCRKSIVIDNVP